MKHMLSVLLAALLLFATVPALAEGEEIFIGEVHSSDEYKDLLMDALDRTVIGQDANTREQIRKVLYLEEITVDSVAYNRILTAANEAIATQSLSENASLEAYTEEDFAIAATLIAEVCDALDLDCTIDPSNDSQNEYARVITIKKNGKVLGRLNSDAKTDVAKPASIAWIVLGGAMLLGAAVLAVWILTRKRSAA